MVAADKQVAIYSDNDSLARVVELNLRRYPTVRSVNLTSQSAGPDGQISTDGFDLVILAISWMTTDPAAMLAEVSSGQARCVPLLIISSEPIRADWPGGVHRLSFPFSAYDFHRRVKEILNGEAATTTAQ